MSGGGVNVLRCVAAVTKQFVDNFDKQDDDDDAVVMRRLDCSFGDMLAITHTHRHAVIGDEKIAIYGGISSASRSFDY